MRQARIEAQSVHVRGREFCLSAVRRGRRTTACVLALQLAISKYRYVSVLHSDLSCPEHACEAAGPYEESGDVPRRSCLLVQHNRKRSITRSKEKSRVHTSGATGSRYGSRTI